MASSSSRSTVQSVHCSVRYGSTGTWFVPVSSSASRSSA